MMMLLILMILLQNILIYRVGGTKKIIKQLSNLLTQKMMEMKLVWIIFKMSKKILGKFPQFIHSKYMLKLIKLLNGEIMLKVLQQVLDIALMQSILVQHKTLFPQYKEILLTKNYKIFKILTQANIRSETIFQFQSLKKKLASLIYLAK